MKAFDDVSQHELHRKLEKPEEKRNKEKIINQKSRKQQCLTKKTGRESVYQDSKMKP
jgi:hypothetical protein